MIWSIVLTLALVPLLSVFASPWDAMHGRASIGSMVSGATSLEGIGPLRLNQVPHTRHLGLRNGAIHGNMTVLAHQTSPPQFIINRRQLYYYLNETTIYPVNVMNTTLPERPPLQLVVGKKKEGIKNGGWRYAGSMLYYDFPGGKGSQGIFWYCPYGAEGVFIFNVKEEHWISDCNSLTFHSFDHS